MVLAGFNADTDRKRVRRELTSEELGRLIEAAHQQTRPEFNLNGPDRAMLYRLAAGTGYISAIVNGGASVKVAQELARHSSPTLTIGRYSHTRLHDVAGALESLPTAARLVATDSTQGVLRATGTENTTAREESLRKPCDSAQRHAQHEAQQMGCGVVLGSAGARDEKPQTPYDSEPPKGLRITALCDVVRSDSTAQEKRRWWESNPRWRICNPLGHLRKAFRSIDLRYTPKSFAPYLHGASVNLAA